MIIRKLNTVFHKHSRILFGAFTLIIIVSFMGFLTPGKFGCDVSGGNRAMGEVYGKKVSVEEVVEFARKALIKTDNANALLFMYALNFRADQLGICVSDEEIGDEIAKRCQKEYGKYDKAMYRKFLAEQEQEYGVSEEVLLESIRLRLKREKLEAFVKSQVEVTPSEVEAVRREYKTRLYFTAASFDEVMIPNDGTLRKFFMHPGWMSRWMPELPWAKNVVRDGKFCCAKVAVFSVDRKNPRAAGDLAYKFRSEINKKPPEKREAEFDVLVKKYRKLAAADKKKYGNTRIEVLKPTWVAEGDADFGVESSPKLIEQIFQSSRDKKTLTAVVEKKANGSKSGTVEKYYVGCLVENTAGRDEFAEAKDVVKRVWRTEQARKLAFGEAIKLATEPDVVAREKKFSELAKVPGVKVNISAKPLVVVKPKSEEVLKKLPKDVQYLLFSGATYFQVGDMIPVPTKSGASIYRLDKRELPTAAMTAGERKEFEEKCRADKAEAAWTAFLEDISVNCKLFEEGRR